jgi:hypothetical protein
LDGPLPWQSRSYFHGCYAAEQRGSPCYGALWAYVLIVSASHSHSYKSNPYHRNMLATLALYVLCAVGSVGLVAGGLYEKRKERVNLSVAAFALSVLFSYFDSFMDKLGRSASLLAPGILCLAGGCALEVTRR